MEKYEEIRNLNSIVIKAFSSSQDNLDILSNISNDLHMTSILVDALICDDYSICCEKTKFISMKMLASYFENNIDMDLLEKLENFYTTNFSSNNYNSSLISSSFSIDLFAIAFKHNPMKSAKLLNDFLSLGPERYPVVILYTIATIKKILKTDGFEGILHFIFEKLPEMAKVFNEMISINSIFQLLLPTIVSQKVHISLFECYKENENVCDVLRTFLKLNYLFPNYKEFDDFVTDYINVFNEIISDNSQMLWKTELLLDLRRTNSFRKLQFDTFYSNLIEKIFAIFENSFESFDQSIEIIINLLRFFGILDQLNCNSTSEEAYSFNKTVMNNCRLLILENLQQIQYNDEEDFNSPIFVFYEKCSILFIDDYINSANNLIKINSIPSFLIIKEIISSHENKPTTSYAQFKEIDKNCLISFLEMENKPINFDIDFLTAFTKIYPPSSFHFEEEYFHALINLIKNLQNTEKIDLQILRKAVDCISEIQILDESQLQFLITNPFFPFLNEESNRKEMKRLFKKISSLPFIDQIVGNILSIPDLDPGIVFDYFRDIPLNLLFDEFIPIIKDKYISISNHLVIVKFIYSTIKRVKDTFYPYMCEQIIVTIKLLCEILDVISSNNAEDFEIQKRILKAITVILQIKSLNIGVFLIYDDDFIFKLISNNTSFLCKIDIELICKDIKFILDYFHVYNENLDFSPEMLNDDSVLLLLKVALHQVQKDSFDFNSLDNIFKFILIMIDNDRIEKPIDGLTEVLLNECINKGLKYNIPYSIYFTISHLFKIQPNLLSTMVQTILSNKISDESTLKDITDSIINGSESQIVNASKAFLEIIQMIPSESPDE